MIESVSRRRFVQTIGGAVLASGSAQARGRAGTTPADAARRDVAQAIEQLHASLGGEQRSALSFPFDHPLRSRVDDNRKIVEPRIEDMATAQQALCREIFRGLCGEDSADRFLRAMRDDYGGFEKYHVAIFGEPGTDGPSEWVLTGRHVTIRADGHDGTLAGSLYYGHADPRRTGNVWAYQGEQAARFFRALDAPQRRAALVDPAQPGAPGLRVATLDAPRKAMVRDLLGAILGPFRRGVGTAQILGESGAVDELRWIGFPPVGAGAAGIPAIWKLEGPAFSWYFHGSPHVHAWLSVGRPARNDGLVLAAS